MQDAIRALGLAAMFLVVVIGAMAAIHVVAISPLWTTIGAAWVGAVGTIGAFVGTIWIATTAERRRRKAELDLARIMAAELWLILPDARGRVQSARAAFNSNTRQANYLDHCIDMLDVIAPWPTTQLAALTCLPNHAAAKLAMASAEIQFCVRQLRYIRSQLGAAEPSDTSYEDNSLGESLMLIDDYLGEGFRQCDAVLATHVV